MAYEALEIMGLHAAMKAGVGSLSASHTVDTTTPIYRLSDGRKNGLVTLAAAQTNPYIQLDRGVGSLDSITRMLIPSGHNLAGADTIKVEADDNAGFASPTSLLAAVAVTAGLIDKTFIAGNTERYVRITFTSASFNPSLGELVYTDTTTLTRGPDHSWSDSKRANIMVTRSQSGVSSKLIQGDERRVFEFTHHRLGTTDDAAIDAWLEEISFGAQNFYFTPPNTAESAIWVELVGPYGRVQDHPVPGAGDPAYEVTFTLEEFID